MYIKHWLYGVSIFSLSKSSVRHLCYRLASSDLSFHTDWQHSMRVI